MSRKRYVIVNSILLFVMIIWLMLQIGSESNFKLSNSSNLLMSGEIVSATGGTPGPDVNIALLELVNSIEDIGDNSVLIDGELVKASLGKIIGSNDQANRHLMMLRKVIPQPKAIVRFLDMISYMEVGEPFKEIATQYPGRTHFEYHLMNGGNSKFFYENWRKFSGSDRGLFGITQVFQVEYTPFGDFNNSDELKDEKAKAMSAIYWLTKLTGNDRLSSVPIVDVLAINGFLNRHFSALFLIKDKDADEAFVRFHEELYERYHSSSKGLTEAQKKRLDGYISKYLRNGTYFL